MEPNTLSILGWEPKVLTIRTVALFGLALSAIGLLVLTFQFFGTAQQGQEAMIRLKYGGLLVNVYERDLQPAATLIDVTTIDELAKLAERQNTVILHMTLNFLHCYLVQCNGITYRFLFSAGKRNTPVIEAPRREMVSYAYNVQQARIIDAKPAENELIGYVFDKNEYVQAQNEYIQTEVEETVIMRRIKI